MYTYILLNTHSMNGIICDNIHTWVGACLYFVIHCEFANTETPVAIIFTWHKFYD